MKLEPNGDFVVREEKTLNTIMAILFFGIFVYGAIYTLVNKAYDPGFIPIFIAGALALAFRFFQKSRSQQVFLRINNNGIYKDEVLVTDWDHLLKAYITEKKSGAIKITDDFVLIIEYTRDDPAKGYRTMVKLTNTQNRSEEEIMEALKHFNP